MKYIYPENKEIWEWYHSYKWEKSSQQCFMYRLRQWYTKERAIQKESLRNKREKIVKEKPIVIPWESLWAKIARKRNELWHNY